MYFVHSGKLSITQVSSADAVQARQVLRITSAGNVQEKKWYLVQHGN